MKFLIPQETARTWKPSELKELIMSETEAAWAAGLFDGEGSVTGNHKEGKARKDGSQRSYARISISNTELNLLTRFKLAVGNVGAINGPYQKHSRHKPIWHYQASHKMARTVAESLLKFASKRTLKRLKENYANF